jgi:predicted O-methyltransferase YrrM
VDVAYWWFRLTSSLRWYLTARTRYDIHSPHLCEFITEVYRDDRHYHAFSRIAALRDFWRGRRCKVQLKTLGAPSRTTRKQHRSAGSLVASNAIGDRSGRLLFRLALWHRPERIIEFGTNAGISTSYLHLADTRTPLDTVEGNGEVAALARESFDFISSSRHLRPAAQRFSDWLADQTLPAAPQRILFFLDGDHRYRPTLDYVEHILNWCDDGSILVIADIHWSEGMERAWTELKDHPRVTASLDLYHFGLLFLRPGMRGPHLALIPTRFKPWRIGVFPV